MTDRKLAFKYAGMVPVQVLAGDLPVFKLDDGDHSNLDAIADSIFHSEPIL